MRRRRRHRQRRGALQIRAQLFEHARKPDTSVIVECVLADIDEALAIPFVFMCRLLIHGTCIPKWHPQKP